MNYYNEFDPKAAAWLRELIAAKLIPDGVVDERSITEILPHELTEYTQCHFFAGIAGWPLALQLAGWPPERPVWTGSCPCQSFSSAGQGKGTGDHRDLWPVFAALIRECRPPIVFGEQVEAAIGYGWLDRVCADMEAEGYAVGAHVLGAHSAGAPHVRQRLYWVADADANGRNESVQQVPRELSERIRSDGDIGGMGHADGEGFEKHREPGELHIREQDRAHSGRFDVNSGVSMWSDSIAIPCRDGKSRRIPSQSALFPLADGLPGRVGLLRGAGNAICPQTAQIFIEAFLGQ